MQTIQSPDGAVIAYERVGPADGAALLLIHAGFVDRAEWQGLLPLLARDHPVVAMDRRGHGASGPYQLGHTLDRDVDDALVVLSQVAQPTTLVAHSASAYIALEVALRSTLVAQVVAYEPPVLGAAIQIEAHRAALALCLAEDDRAGLVGIVLNDIVGGATGQRLPAPALAAVLQTPFGQLLLRNARSIPIELESYAAYDFDAQRFATLEIPTVSLVGSKSPPANRRITDQLHATLPQHEIAVLEGQGHGAMMEAPDVFATVLRRALT
jgi:pimeloyl-ACP methyl ester carboxylesterase